GEGGYNYTPEGDGAKGKKGIKMARRREVQNLYYIAPVENLPSILREGILSHAEVQRRGIPYLPIYDESIVKSRQQRMT
ncbi:MAG: DarT ssDNA thymidine ADP-ribosyltransferase family protein, partial [Anaerolineae bacterium]